MSGAARRRPLSQRLDRWSVIMLCLWSVLMLLKLVLANAEEPDSFIFKLQVWPLLAGYLITDRLADEAREEENGTENTGNSGNRETIW